MKAALTRIAVSTEMFGSDAWEVLAHRVMWTFVVCAAVLLLRRDWRGCDPLLVRRRVGLGVWLR